MSPAPTAARRQRHDLAQPNRQRLMVEPAITSDAIAGSARWRAASRIRAWALGISASSRRRNFTESNAGSFIDVMARTVATRGW